ncbi:MAG TPA: SRPBCC family protein, partial [Myxococcota bacterium]|nr:SRPBCC family protein [Myxococcota bacterium]
GGGLDGVRLREVRCERWAGLWMVCFDDDAPPLAAGARLDAVAREHRMDDLAVIARTETVVACSWQLGVEGGLENLHLPVLHRRSGGHALDVDRATYEVHGEHSLVVAPYRPADLYAPTGPFGRAIAAAGVELLTPVGSNAARENTTALLFPHVSLSFVPHHLWVMVMQPIGPAAALQIHLTLALPPRDEDARRLLGVTHAAIAAVLAEDVAILEGLQSNLGRGLAPPIPLSDHEIRVAWFRDALAARRSA